MCNKQTSQTTEITGTTDSKKQTAKVSSEGPKSFMGVGGVNPRKRPV